MIVINPKNLIPDETWLYFRKVRAIIENNNGDIIISNEGGKYIFPGGKCDPNENELDAIQREIYEETGIKLNSYEFKKVLELYTIYDDFYDIRTDSLKPRHTITTYYRVKTNQDINLAETNLTEDEKKQNFRIFFVDKETLYKMLKEDHSHLENGKFFDEENDIVMQKILAK